MRGKKLLRLLTGLMSVTGFILLSLSASAAIIGPKVYTDGKGAQVTILPYKAAGDDKALVEVSGLPNNNPWNNTVTLDTMYEGKDPVSLSMLLTASEKRGLQLVYRGDPDLLTVIYQAESGPIMYTLGFDAKTSKRFDAKALIARQKK